jgi:hypothetical protein
VQRDIVEMLVELPHKGFVGGYQFVHHFLALPRESIEG